MKHKHAELIHAWADGAEIQMKDKYGDWFDTCGNLTWYEEREFRIKPEPKPDLIELLKVSKKAMFLLAYDNGLANLKLIWDGETGKLKSAEVLK